MAALCGGGCGSLEGARWQHLGQRKRLCVEGAARLLEQLRGARAAALWRGGCTAGSENPTALAPEHRAPRHSPGFGLPRYRQRPGGPRTARTLLPRAQQTSSPTPEPPGPADGFLRSYCRAEYRFSDLATATGVVPPWASRGKQPPLSASPGRGRGAPPRANT